MANFDDNFDRLKKAGVIPETSEDFLPPRVRGAIADLSDDEIKLLIDIANKTGGYVFIHTKDDSGIMTGY
jgi:hypothetical protein